MRLRSDLAGYLTDLRLSGQFSSELVRLVLVNAMGTGKELYQEFIAKEQDALKMRRKHSELIASQQALRKDYRKLIGT